LNVSTANEADDAGNDGDDDYAVDGENESSDDSDDDDDDDFNCSDSDDSVVKTSKKKAESKSSRGRGQAQKKTDVKKPAPGTKRIYFCTAEFLTCIEFVCMKNITI